MPQTRCPECGLDVPERPPRLPAARKAVRRGIWVLVLFGAVVYYALGATSYRGSDGSFPPRFPSKASSIEEVRTLAGGGVLPSVRPGEFSQSIIDAGREPYLGAPFNAKVFVAFGAPPHVLHRTVRWGFPFTSVQHETYSVYQDALIRRGFRPSVTNASVHPLDPFEDPNTLPLAPVRPLWAWWGDWNSVLVHQPPPELTGGVFVTRQFHVSSIALLLATTVLVAAIIHAIWNRVRTPKIGSRVRRRLISFAVAMAIILGVTLAAREIRETTGHPNWLKSRQVGLAPQPVFWVFEDLGELPLSRTDILELRSRPDGDALLARAILAAVPTTRQNGHFVVWTVFEGALPAGVPGRRNIWSIPVASVNRHTFYRHPLFGNTDRISATPGWKVRLSRNSVRFGAPIGSDMWTLGLRLPQLVAFIVSIFTMHWLLTTGARLLLAWRVRRRFRCGRCTKCGYSLV